MRAYKVTVHDGDELLATRFAGTQADVRAMRDQLMSDFNVKKKDVSTEETEIPMGKAELLKFINELSAAADLVDESDG